MRSLLVVNEQFSDEHNADIGHYGQILIVSKHYLVVAVILPVGV